MVLLVSTLEVINDTEVKGTSVLILDGGGSTEPF